MSDETRTTQEYALDFIKAFADTEAEILPYKEHLKDLKKNYVENGWLTNKSDQDFYKLELMSLP